MRKRDEEDLFSQFREEGVEEDAVPFAVGDVVKGVVFVALGEREGETRPLWWGTRLGLEWRWTDGGRSIVPSF